MTYYLVSILAFHMTRYEDRPWLIEVDHRPLVVMGNSPEEARELALTASLDTWSVADGWLNHASSVMEIPESFIEEIRNFDWIAPRGTVHGKQN